MEGKTIVDESNAAKEKARKTYDAAADHFEAAPLAFWSRIGETTVAKIDLASGAEVLDVGCGNGASALPAAAAVGPSGRVVGVDLSTRLLDQGRRRAATAGLANIEFRAADMTALDYPDARFDAVISVFSIFFVPNMEGLVGELWRMVRPGGRLAVTTWGPDIFEPAYSHWLDTLKREAPHLHSAFNPWDRITDVESVRQLMRDGGTTEPDVVAEEGAQELERPEDWWAIAMGSGLRWAIDQMGPEKANAVRQDNLDWIARQGVDAVATNAIYAVARKPSNGNQ